MSYGPIVAEMTQHPVGQGGFFYGTLSRGDNTVDFRWVYDCGSDKKYKEELHREIDRIKIPRGQKIDTLYISHFHEDHVSGIQYLLSRCRVKRFVIPHLNQHEKIYTLLHYIETSTELTDFVRELIVNPERFRQNNHIEQMIRVRGRRAAPGDERDIAPVGGPTEESGEESAFTDVWSPEPDPDPEYPIASGSASKQGTYVVSGDATASVSIKEVRFDWEFIPHVYPMSEKEQKNLRNGVKRLTANIQKGELTDDDIHEIMKDNNMSNLLDLYKNTSLGPNPLSMSLYMGPKLFGFRGLSPVVENKIDLIINNHPLEFFRNTYYPAFIDSDNSVCYISDTRELRGGWILTGDSEFCKNDHFERFKNRYRKYKPLIDVVMVPHHGSAYNVEQDFFDFFDHFFITYVAAGPGNRHKHPSPRVVCMACASAPFYVVGTDPASELKLRSEWWFH